jgi:hypothetical protein
MIARLYKVCTLKKQKEKLMLSDEDKFVVDELVKLLILHVRENSKSWEMLKIVDNHSHSRDWPARKLNRWIGYAQCLIIAEGGLSLEDVIRKTREVESAAREIFSDVNV